MPIATYELSSQYLHWRFTPPSLQKAREETHASAVTRISNAMRLESSLSSGSSSISFNPPPPHELLLLQTFYLSKIREISNALNFPETVEATAVSYVKRFYLRNTAMDYHPKNIMLTCLWLSTKTENWIVEADKFADMVRADREEILKLEFVICQSLGFQFKVHHAHTAAYGLFLDMQSLDLDPTRASKLHESLTDVQALLAHARLTDLEFLYSPSQIALATFVLVDPEEAWRWLAAKEELKPQKGDVEMGNEEMKLLLEEIGRCIREQEERKVELETVRAVDKQLRLCMNPEKDPNSALYKMKMEEKERREREEELEKAEKRAMEVDDVFG
ncbi:cyclin-like protein [Atractiella rhizophila]|nr:cyclin-like protein [Atractiella rhizophila]